MYDACVEFFTGLSWWQKTLLSAGVFVVTFSLSLAAVGWFLVKIPPTFFLDGHRRDWGNHPSAWVRWTLKIAKNLFGLVLVVAGVIQLFMPGQGLLTILIGVVLLDFPGKRQVERKIVSRPKVLAAVNHLRARYGRPPLIVEEDDQPKPAPPRPREAEKVGQTR
jgi:hypothetical protein